MDIYKLPNCRMYWAPYSKVSIIADTMPRNCFEEILRHLHYNGISLDLNKNDPSHNKLFKIQPLIDHFCEVFQSAILPEIFMSIDEMTVAFKRRHSAKVYMPKKPTKVGYKMCCRNGISGYKYQFEVLGGKDSSVPPADCNPPQRLGESEFVVLHMCNGLVTGKHKVFFDNLFSSPELMKYLLSKGIYGVATLRANRSRSCPTPAEKDMKKQDRGAMTEVVDTEQKVVAVDGTTIEEFSPYLTLLE